MAMMISKFHKLIQSKIVWGAFAVLISIAFVGVYTPGAKSRSEAKREQKEGQLAGRLFGEEITRSEFGQAYHHVVVMYTMQYGDISMNDQIAAFFRAEAWQRLAILKKAEQAGLRASDLQIESAIQNHPIFQSRETGQFDKNIYIAFTSTFLPRVNMSPKGFETMISEQILIDQISSTPLQGALVTDTEIKRAYHLMNDLLTVEYALIPRSMVKAPKVTEDEAKEYFDRDPGEFELPETVSVNYARFAAADYLDTVEATDEMVASYYESSKDLYRIEPAEDAPEGTPESYKPLEEVKEEIVGKIKQALALQAARIEADNLVAALSDPAVSFETAATEMGASIVKDTPPFSQATSEIAGINPLETRNFAHTAFTLEKTASHYYSDAVIGSDAAYVITLVGKHPPRIPEFSEVQDDAMEYAKLAAEEKAYIDMAKKMEADIKASVKAGEAFAEAVGQQKLELATTPPFSVAKPLEDAYANDIMAATGMLDAGKLTGLIAAGDEEYLLAYIADKTVSDEADLPARREELTRRIAGQKSSRLVAAWRENLLKEARFEDLLQRADNES